MKIGLKYCGGCNPDYDRKSVAERLVRALGDRVCWVRGGDEEASALLVLAGCRTACVRVEEPPQGPVWIVVDAESAERTGRELKLFVGAAGP